MSFIDCIQTAVDTGKISQEKGDQAKAAFSEAVADDIRSGVSPDEAAESGGLKALKSITSMTQESRIQKLRELEKLHDIYKEFTESKKPLETLYGKLDKLQRGAETNSGVVSHFIESLMTEYEPRNFGLSHPMENDDNLIEQAYGNPTTEYVKDLYEGVKGATQWLMDRMKAEGIFVPENPNFRLWQRHSRLKVRQISKIEFVNDHMGRADWDLMQYAGKLIPAAERELRMGNMYDSIITNGAPEIDEIGVKANANLANRLSRERFMYYKDAKSWKEMNDKYGSGSVYEQIVGGLHSWSKDLSILQQFGPNEETARQFMMNTIHHLAGEEEKVAPKTFKKGIFKGETRSEISKFDDARDTFNKGYDTFRNLNPSGEENIIAQVGGTIRGVILAGKLPFVVASAATGDPMLAKIFAGLYGLKETGIFKDYMGQMMAGKGAFKQALSDGTALDSAMGTHANNLRANLVDGPKWARKVADVELRAGGVLKHHMAMKAMIGTRFAMEMADHAETAFDDVPFKKGLEAHGVSPEEWDAFRKTPKYEYDSGAEGIRPLDAQLGAKTELERNAGDKMADFLTNNLTFANPRPGLRTQVALGHNLPSGTIGGQFIRTAGMLKSFPAEMWYNQVGQIMRNASPVDKIKMLAKFTLLMTLGGAMKVQLSNLYNGKDPENMVPDNASGLKFWGKALMEGGGLTLAGEFLVSIFNPDKPGTATDDTQKKLAKLFADSTGIGVKEGHAPGSVAGDAFSLGSGLIPAPWQVKFLWRMTLQDELMQMTDPAGYQRMMASQIKTQQQTGQGNYARDGRLPNVGNVVQ